MKEKIINTVVCDMRNVSEESLQGYEAITVNATVLVLGEHSAELLNRYPVTLNTTHMLRVPDGQDVSVKIFNGTHEIGPEGGGNGIVLIVNGKLMIQNNSLDAVKSYFQIFVNGKLLMPESYGHLPNVSVSGRTEYYPDGASVLDADAKIDDLFIIRSKNTLYYCPGTIFFLDAAMNAEMLLEKGLRFAAKKIVIADGLLLKLVSQFDEKAKIVRVPDGTQLIGKDLDLKPKTIRKYGTKLYVCGDVAIMDADALDELEYLYADGCVRVSKELEEAFDEIDSVYEELKIVYPNKGHISDRAAVTISSALLEQFANGLIVEDCAKVTLSEDLLPDDILKKLEISDCALVCCTREQEAAVNLIATDIARLRVYGQENSGSKTGSSHEPSDGENDVNIISAVAYTM